MTTIKNMQADQKSSSPVHPGLMKYGWLILACWMAVVFFLVNFLLPGLLSSQLFIYIIQPVLWCSVGLLALGLYRRHGKSFSAHPGENTRGLGSRNFLITGGMLGGIQVVAAVLLGLLLGFGNYPYAHTFGMIALNLLFVFSRLAGIETARWYLGRAAGRKHSAGIPPGLAAPAGHADPGG